MRIPVQTIFRNTIPMKTLIPILIFSLALLSLTCQRKDHSYDNPLDSDGSNYQVPSKPVISGPGQIVTCGAEYAITWKADRASHYTVQESASPDFANPATVATDSSAQRYSHTVKKPTVYYYKVKALNGDHTSSWSDSVQVIVNPAIPEAPKELKAINITASTIMLTWTDVSDNEEGFRIERKESVWEFAEVATVKADSFSYAIKELTPESSYSFRVRANNTAGFSDYSNEISVKMPNLPTISGKITGADGVSIKLSGSASETQIVNNDDLYSFKVKDGGNYSITPSKTGYLFTPAIKSFYNVIANKTQDFSAAKQTFTISGKISGADGVTVALSGDATGSQIVNDGETFSFIVMYGGNYSITTLKNGYTFTPSNKSFSNIISNQIQNYSATRLTITISGTVSGTSGITLSLAGYKSETKIISIDGGNYSFTVDYGENYSVTPSKVGYNFTPAYHSFINVTSNQTQNYSASFIGLIAFTSSRSGYGDIFIMSPDGNGQTQLTFDPTYDQYPSFSPDGSKIVFTSHRSGRPEIYSMDVDGSKQTRLTYDSNKINAYPTWSPDGLKIAYISYSGQPLTPQLVVMNSDGTGQTNIETGNEQPLYAAWSPNGNKIAFFSNNGYSPIYIINTDGSGLTNISHGYSDQYPAWSPDGSKIALNSYSGNYSDIWIMNSDGSNKVRLTNSSAINEHPSWSPDGLKIVFSSNRDGNKAIFVMNADGTGQMKLTNSQGNRYGIDEQPVWSPRK